MTRNTLALSALFVGLTACLDKNPGGDDTGTSPDLDGDGVTVAEGDCDDSEATVYPEADELCDAVDNNCDGQIDEDPTDAAIWYRDADGDGYGASDNSQAGCDQPSGFLADATDCDDLDAEVSPAGTESCNDVDDDCDGETDEADAVDAATWYADTDGDGYGDAASTLVACDGGTSHVADNTDCDDANSNSNPGAIELCNGLDDDCDSTVDEDDASDAMTWYQDADADGYGDPDEATLACTVPSGYLADNTDCNDYSADRYPGADEYCNGFDDDCDGTVDENYALDTLVYYTDADGDGYGDATITQVACNPSMGWTSDATDCDDTDSSINPGESDWCADGVDNDCDGADETLNGLLTWQYNDSDADGVVDFIVRYEQNSDGENETAYIDTDADGTSDYTYHWIYDADGNLTQAYYDAYGSIYVYFEATYDIDGNLTWYAYDSDTDGSWDETTTYSYDSDGNVTVGEDDDDGDGVADSITYYIYDTDGNIIQKDQDTDGDGTLDRSTTYTYDTDGDLLTGAVDSDVDGATDADLFWEYDANGNLTSVEMDADLDGTTDLTLYEATYDSSDNMTWEAWDNDYDGTWDEQYTWTYDAGGNLTEYAEDDDADGNPETTETYDSAGYNTQVDLDDDSDGVMDRTIWYFYACDDAA